MKTKEFRKLLNQQKAERAEKAIELTAPSGLVYEVQNPDFEMFALAGIMPVGLAEKMEAARQKGATNEQAFSSLSTEEKEKSFDFSRRIVKSICLNPRVVEVVTNEDEEISLEEMASLPKDFEFLINWAMGGGGNDSLDSFRNERSPSDVGDTNGKSGKRKPK